MLSAAAYPAVASVAFVLLIRLIYFAHARVLAVLPRLMLRQAQALKVGSTQVVDANQLFPLVRRTLHTPALILMLLLGYEWLRFCSFHASPIHGLGARALMLTCCRSRPTCSMAWSVRWSIAISIFFIARSVSGFVQRLLRRMSAPRQQRCLAE